MKKTGPNTYTHDCSVDLKYLAVGECKPCFGDPIKSIDYQPSTGKVWDDKGNLIGTGEWRDGILVVTYGAHK